MSFATDQLTKAQTAYTAALDLFATGRAPTTVVHNDQTVTFQMHLDMLLKHVDTWQARVNAENGKNKSGRNRIRTGRL